MGHNFETLKTRLADAPRDIDMDLDKMVCSLNAQTPMIKFIAMTSEKLIKLLSDDEEDVYAVDNTTLNGFVCLNLSKLFLTILDIESINNFAKSIIEEEELSCDADSKTMIYEIIDLILKTAAKLKGAVEVDVEELDVDDRTVNIILEKIMEMAITFAVMVVMIVLENLGIKDFNRRKLVENVIMINHIANPAKITEGCRFDGTDSPDELNDFNTLITNYTKLLSSMCMADSIDSDSYKPQPAAINDITSLMAAMFTIIFMSNKKVRINLATSINKFKP